MDNLSKKQRSYCMSRIKGKGTSIELKFRKLLKINKITGYRSNNRLLGKPDFYFPKLKIAVFIDGCFWHKCPKCYIRPKSKNEYWDKKIANNVIRDKRNTRELKKMGIRVVRIWEHEVKKDPKRCYNKIKRVYEKKI